MIDSCCMARMPQHNAFLTTTVALSIIQRQVALFRIRARKGISGQVPQLAPNFSCAGAYLVVIMSLIGLNVGGGQYE